MRRVKPIDAAFEWMYHLRLLVAGDGLEGETITTKDWDSFRYGDQKFFSSIDMILNMEHFREYEHIDTLEIRQDGYICLDPGKRANSLKPDQGTKP
jgi:hypothetical protein